MLAQFPKHRSSFVWLHLWLLRMLSGRSGILIRHILAALVQPEDCTVADHPIAIDHWRRAGVATTGLVMLLAHCDVEGCDIRLLKRKGEAGGVGVELVLRNLVG